MSWCSRRHTGPPRGTMLPKQRAHAEAAAQGREREVPSLRHDQPLEHSIGNHVRRTSYTENRTGDSRRNPGAQFSRAPRMLASPRLSHGRETDSRLHLQGDLSNRAPKSRRHPTRPWMPRAREIPPMAQMRRLSNLPVRFCHKSAYTGSGRKTGGCTITDVRAGDTWSSVLHTRARRLCHPWAVQVLLVTVRQREVAAPFRAGT